MKQNKLKRYRWFVQLKRGIFVPAKQYAQPFLGLPLCEFHTYCALEIARSHRRRIVYMA